MSPLKVKVERIETDILVIGGGLAGTFAAIKAKEASAEKVTLVSKGKLGKDSISRSYRDELTPFQARALTSTAALSACTMPWKQIR